MHLFYVDPGLISHTGHHASCCRAFLAETRRRGIGTTVLANNAVESGLRSELGALPLFQASPYYIDAGDPLSGWLEAFLRGSQLTAADFSRLSRFSKEDVFYVTGCAPAQLMGIVDWVARFAPGTAPSVVIDLIYQSGMVLKGTGAAQSWEPADPREDPRAILYRLIGRNLQDRALPSLHFVTEHPALPQVYSALLSKPVAFSAALPYALPQRVTPRGGRKPITLGVVGHQRPDKGYLLMPELFAALLKTEKDIRIVAHNSGAPDLRLPAVEEALTALAAADPRLTLDGRALDAGDYLTLLESIDLMLCPYDPVLYRTNLSGVTLECIANAIPVVVPGGTVLETHTRTFGDMSTAFAEFAAPSIVAAARAAIARFDQLTRGAKAASDIFAQHCGPGQFVDMILGLAAQSAPAAPPPA